MTTPGASCSTGRSSAWTGYTDWVFRPSSPALCLRNLQDGSLVGAEGTEGLGGRPMLGAKMTTASSLPSKEQLAPPASRADKI